MKKPKVKPRKAKIKKPKVIECFGPTYIPKGYVQVEPNGWVRKG